MINYICKCGHDVAEHKKLNDGSMRCFYGWKEFGFICTCTRRFEIIKEVAGVEPKKTPL